MPVEEDLLPPLEVPWKLASTTQPLSIDGPNGLSVSTFFFQPEDELLSSTFPGEKLLYLKFSVSVSPCKLREGDPTLALGFFGESLPSLHILLDLKLTPESGETGDIRPYFHAAAPMNRRLIQSGIVGGDLFEGSASSQSFGKSGSQLYESLDSSSGTTSKGGSAGFGIGIGPFGFSVGASAQSTGTSVSSDRSVEQIVDTTARDASQERRELTSHMSKVENVLTLLNAKFLGSPYLRFSLFPRPLQMLSLDPGDPNLWFQQLLQRRSSGIEGVQEFTTVVLVPEEEEFCVEANLHRICLLDNFPEPAFDEVLGIRNADQYSRMQRYMKRKYPQGTPLELLDIDIFGALDPEKFVRPVIWGWMVRRESPVVMAFVESPSNIPGQASVAAINYKHVYEVWLETLRAEFDDELQRSPLERGVILHDRRTLETCFAPNEAGDLQVSRFSSSEFNTPRPVDLDFDIGDFGVDSDDLTVLTRTRATQTLTRWNSQDQRLNTFLYNLNEFPEQDSSLNNSRVVNILVERWGRLSPDDERNISVSAASEILGLSDQQRCLLKDAGAKTIRDIARLLNAAPGIEKLNTEVKEFRDYFAAETSVFARSSLVLTQPEVVEFGISASQAAQIKREIGKCLQGNTVGIRPKRRGPRKRPGNKRPARK